MTTEPAELEPQDELGVLLVYLAEQGYAEQVGSWVSDSVTNVPLTGAQLLAALPDEALSEVAAELGLPVEEYAEQLAQELPSLVDGLTPQGELPTDDDFEDFLWEFLIDDTEAPKS
ncbi:YidB family protein [Streptomyces sp. NPDC091268]|uniref:YidB family protein n=1 Tax=Streptomyces sp. NPDC091268 TaxID=3365979 RepID=UPI00381F9723